MLLEQYWQLGVRSSSFVLLFSMSCFVRQSWCWPLANWFGHDLPGLPLTVGSQAEDRTNITPVVAEAATHVPGRFCCRSQLDHWCQRALVS